jgi:hypothetical protein
MTDARAPSSTFSPISRCPRTWSQRAGSLVHQRRSRFAAGQPPAGSSNPRFGERRSAAARLRRRGRLLLPARGRPPHDRVGDLRLARRRRPLATAWLRTRSSARPSRRTTLLATAERPIRAGRRSFARSPSGASELSRRPRLAMSKYATTENLGRPVSLSRGRGRCISHDGSIQHLMRARPGPPRAAAQLARGRFVVCWPACRYRVRHAGGSEQGASRPDRDRVRGRCRPAVREWLHGDRGEASRVRLAASRGEFARSWSRGLVAGCELHAHGRALLHRGTGSCAEPEADCGTARGAGADLRGRRWAGRFWIVRDRPGGWLSAVVS